jgi:hypothetical protein
MLLIGQPKSATTALACTLAKITGKQYVLGVPKESHDIKCEGYTEIQKYHNNMIERSPLFLKQVITGKNKIFKEHLLPTERHLKILDKYKDPIIILLRDPEHSLDSYERLFKSKNKKFNKKQLFLDLLAFNTTYRSYKKENILIVEYIDLITNYNETIKSIMNHYKMTGKIIPLMKKKYTGVGEKRINDLRN